MPTDFLRQTLPRSNRFLNLIFGPILAVAIYMTVFAVPRYNALQWNSETHFVNSLAAPQVAIFASCDEPRSASFGDDWKQCVFPTWRGGSDQNPMQCVEGFSAKMDEVEMGRYGRVRGYVFTPGNMTRFRHTAGVMSLDGPVKCT
jgi:hypothetical protein